MSRIEQHIANPIARTQMMATDRMHEWFVASVNKIQDLEMQMQPTIQQENGNKKIARAFISLLSLVVEYCDK